MATEFPPPGEDGLYGFGPTVNMYRGLAAAAAERKAETERLWQIVQAQFARPPKPAPPPDAEPAAGNEG